MLRRRLHSASVPAKLSDLHFGVEYGGEDGLAVGEPQIKPVSSMTRVMSLTRICEDRTSLLACTDSELDALDVPNWVLAMRISSGSSKSTLFAGTRITQTQPHCPIGNHCCLYTLVDTAALDAEDASKSPEPRRPRHRRSVSSGDASAVAKAARDSLKAGLPSEPL